MRRRAEKRSGRRAQDNEKTKKSQAIELLNEVKFKKICAVA